MEPPKIQKAEFSSLKFWPSARSPRCRRHNNEAPRPLQFSLRETGPQSRPAGRGGCGQPGPCLRPQPPDGARRRTRGRHAAHARQRRSHPASEEQTSRLSTRGCAQKGGRGARGQGPQGGEAAFRCWDREDSGADVASYSGHRTRTKAAATRHGTSGSPQGHSPQAGGADTWREGPVRNSVCSGTLRPRFMFLRTGCGRGASGQGAPTRGLPGR